MIKSIRMVPAEMYWPQGITRRINAELKAVDRPGCTPEAQMAGHRYSIHSR